MKKTKSHAFGKDIYLLGRDEQGICYWLESPVWECSWYWGFGYIKTYTNNKNPHLAKDIGSHQHASKFLSEWFTSWNGSKPILKNATFTDKEGWELSELFSQFYFLKEAGEMFSRGKANCTNTSIERWKKPLLVKEINETILLKVMSRILEILTP